MTFDEKYIRDAGSVKGMGSKGGGSKGSGMASMSRKVPADITEEQTNKVQEYTRRAFKALNSKGVVRIDFIIDNDDGKVYINEINTIPGSFAFYLWCHDKEIMYPELIDMIINVAEKEHAEKLKNNYTYNSNIIAVQGLGGCKGGKFGG